jgi:hypothetical protein
MFAEAIRSYAIDDSLTANVAPFYSWGIFKV